MDRAVYAIFEDRRTAAAAMDALISQGVPEELIDVQLQSGELDEEELPAPATSSRRFVKFGAPVVAIVGAVVGGITAGLVGALLGLLFGAVLGTVAAALSGSVDAKPEVRRLGNELDDTRRGRTLLLIDVSATRGGLDYEQFLQEHGAVRVDLS